MKKSLSAVILTVLLLLTAAASRAQETYCFAERESGALYLDLYRPVAGAQTSLDGIAKPAVLFVFGGGFVGGRRNDPDMFHWYNRLAEDGYSVVAIDYRLGMKDYQVGKGLAGAFKAVDRFLYSQQIGVEDVFAAVRFLADHPELGVDPAGIVLVGSSAGAIISLACAYAVANGEAPDGIRFKGVMSFAGAIISTSGAPKFREAPCPLAMFHGTADGAVAYNHTGAFGKGIWGSSYLAKQFKKKGWTFQIWRFDGYNHDVAAYMDHLWPIEKEFLENDVIRGIARSVDATVDDPTLPHWKAVTLDTLY